MSLSGNQAADQFVATPSPSVQRGRRSVPKWESESRIGVKATVRRLLFALTVATLAGIAGSSGALASASASPRQAAPLGAVAVLLQADGGCSRLVGRVGTGNVSISYSSLFDSYSGTIAGQRLSVSYSSLFDSYSGSVAGQRISMSYSTLFDSYSGTVGRDRIRISYSSLSDSYSGSIGPHRVSLRCS